MRKAIIVIVVLILFAGAIYALREPIGCFFYLRSSHEGQIAFLRDDGVYVMDADGANQCFVAAGEFDNPVWSPDGSHLALTKRFGSYSARPAISVYTFRGDSVGLQPLFNDIGNMVETFRWSPTWSADSTQIAFLARRYSDDLLAIFAVEIGAGEPHALTDDTIVGQPVWSPDGSKIAFVLFDSNSFDPPIFVKDGANVMQVAAGTSQPNLPVWSPNSERIAFVDIDHDLAIVNADGSDLQTFPAQDFAVLNMAWSPTGAQIALRVIDFDSN